MTFTPASEPTVPPASTNAAGPDPYVASDARLGHHDALDDALVAIRRVLLRPGYRKRLLEGLPVQIEPAALRLLRTVQRSDGPPSIGEVAEALMIDPSTASRLVEGAVAAGQLERRACSDDRRRARLHLTEAGRDLLDRATARRRDLLAEITRTWPDEELVHLVDSLQELLAGFDELEGSA